MKNLIKKILIFSLISGCKNSSSHFIEPVTSSSAKGLSPPMYSIKVEVVKVNGRNFLFKMRMNL